MRTRRVTPPCVIIIQAKLTEGGGQLNTRKWVRKEQIHTEAEAKLDNTPAKRKVKSEHLRYVGDSVYNLF